MIYSCLILETRFDNFNITSSIPNGITLGSPNFRYVYMLIPGKKIFEFSLSFSLVSFVDSYLVQILVRISGCSILTAWLILSAESFHMVGDSYLCCPMLNL